MNEKQLWDKFLEVIKDKLSSISYDTWFKDTPEGLKKILDQYLK